jgi:hypothetical protein
VVLTTIYDMLRYIKATRITWFSVFT